MNSLQQIQEEALHEIEAEQHRAAVDAAKIRIREAMKRKRWWHYFFPFAIKVTLEKLPNV